MMLLAEQRTFHFPPMVFCSSHHSVMEENISIYTLPPNPTEMPERKIPVWIWISACNALPHLHPFKSFSTAILLHGISIIKKLLLGTAVHSSVKCLWNKYNWITQDTYAAFTDLTCSITKNIGLLRGQPESQTVSGQPASQQAADLSFISRCFMGLCKQKKRDWQNLCWSISMQKEVGNQSSACRI